MKTKLNFGRLLVAFLLVAGMTACINEDDKEGDQVTNYQEYELTVASKQLLSLINSPGGKPYFIKSYAVKKEGGQAWSPFADNIQGFDYEEGYEYRIKISETWYVDYRKGDPSWTEYKLLEVLSQEKCESENLPAYLLPDGYKFFNMESRYVIEADKKENVEQYLTNTVFLKCKQYVFNETLTEFALLNEETENLILTQGGLYRETYKEMKFPDSYQRIPIEGQVASAAQWVFIFDHVIYAENISMDAFFVRLSGTRSQVWLYKDLTQEMQEAFPDAGVKTVVMAQILSNSEG